MNAIVSMLMNRLQQKNPQGHQVIQNLMNSNGNPQAMLQQLVSNASPEQKAQVLRQAKSYGVPQDILSKIQNMQ